MKIPNIQLLEEMLKTGRINKVKHPTENLYIYNYSKVTNFEGPWNEITKMCRGLVCDGDYNIISRPFEKFFNYEELLEKYPELIPDISEPFEVTEKLDGSLGIMYWIKDTPYICTRGRFDSDQGIHATKILHEKYSNKFKELDKTKTYLFEIIYPEDCHIVKYGGIDDIFLLAVIDTETGEEQNLLEWSHIFKCTTRYDGIKDYKEIRNLFDGTNKEGFVVKFRNGFRLKLKYKEWFELNYIKSLLSKKKIFEYIVSDNLEELENLLKNIKDEEIVLYYRNILREFQDSYEKIYNESKEYYKDFDSDKEAAEYFKTFKYPGILFGIRKNYNISKLIWSIIKKNI